MNAHSILSHRIRSRQRCLWLFMLSVTVAYFHSYGRHLFDDFMLTIQMLPGAIIFSWWLLPGNFFRNIMNGEPTPPYAPYIVAFWLVFTPIVVAFVYSKRTVLLLLIATVLVLSTHGCAEWVKRGGF